MACLSTAVFMLSTSSSWNTNMWLIHGVQGCVSCAPVEWHSLAASHERKHEGVTAASTSRKPPISRDDHRRTPKQPKLLAHRNRSLQLNPRTATPSTSHYLPRAST